MFAKFFSEVSDLEKALRKLLANIADRTIVFTIAANTATMLKLKFVEGVLLFLFMDFMVYVVIRVFLKRTPGDIMFGVVLKADFPRFLRLSIRWLLGYLSPITGFLLHVPAIRWKSFCDAVVGIDSEVI